MRLAREQIFIMGNIIQTVGKKKRVGSPLTSLDIHLFTSKSIQWV